MKKLKKFFKKKTEKFIRRTKRIRKKEVILGITMARAVA